MLYNTNVATVFICETYRTWLQVRTYEFIYIYVVKDYGRSHKSSAASQLACHLATFLEVSNMDQRWPSITS